MLSRQIRQEQLFPSSFDLIFSSPDELQFLMNQSNLLHCKYAQKSMEFPANIFLFKVNNRNIRKRCEIWVNTHTCRISF